MNYGGYPMQAIIGLVLVVIGAVLMPGSAYISYRFFYSSDKASLAMKFVGVVLSLFGFILFLESFGLI